MLRKHAMSMTISAILLAAPLAAPLAAQEAAQSPMSPEMMAMMEAYQQAAAPGAEHQRLADMAGTYDMTIKSWYVPGAEPTTDTGTAIRKMILGDRVMVEDANAQMMGQPFTGHGMQGYDNVSATYWATWNDNMGTGLMVSKGTCDASMACTFTGQVNDPVSRQPQTLRLSSHWTAADTEVFELYGPDPEGKETRMLEITYVKRDQ